jgi:hypothetical protein
LEKLHTEIMDSLTRYLVLNKLETSDSTMKHLIKVCLYFDEIEEKLLYFKTVKNSRTITSISKSIMISRVSIYKNEILSKYINHRDEKLVEIIRRLDISDHSIDLEKEINMLNIRDATLENISFENDNLRQENTFLKKELDRVKKQLSMKKS